MCPTHPVFAPKSKAETRTTNSQHLGIGPVVPYNIAQFV